MTISCKLNKNVQVSMWTTSMKQHFFINRVICETCVTILSINEQVSHALCDSQGSQVTLWSRAVKHVTCACTKCTSHSQ